jgi:hypothetical protein
MKNKLHLVVTIVCLLTLFISTASCIAAQLPHTPQASCNDCPGHAPVSHDNPVCCTAHQQPSAAATSVKVERPAYLSQALIPFSLDLPASSAVLLAPQLSETPPLPSLIALRI